MRVQPILFLTMMLSGMAACAQDGEEGRVRPLNAVQAHLQAMNPETPRSASVGPAIARLLGKMLTAGMKDPADDDQGPREAAPPNAAALQDNGLHLNRRAEVCYDNYRLGFKRDGMVLRYEKSF